MHVWTYTINSRYDIYLSAVVFQTGKSAQPPLQAIHTYQMDYMSCTYTVHIFVLTQTNRANIISRRVSAATADCWVQKIKQPPSQSPSFSYVLSLCRIACSAPFWVFGRTTNIVSCLFYLFGAGAFVVGYYQCIVLAFKAVGF